MATTGIFCRKCGYDLRGQVAGAGQRCPECGRPFDIQDRRTFRDRPFGDWKRTIWKRGIQVIVAALLLVSLLLAGTLGVLYWGWKSEQRVISKLGGTYRFMQLGGEDRKGYLGPMYWVVDRAEWVFLPASATDADMVQVKKLKWLKMVAIGHTRVTDAGLVHLKELKDLEEIDLGYSLVTDAGLAHVKDCKRVRVLALWGNTRITDAGLVHLKKCENLEHVYLEDTPGISPTGVRELQTAFPGAEIKK